MTYQLHESSRQLRDQDRLRDIDVLVASGDCFELLATRIDQLARTVSAIDAKQLPEIESLIQTLLLLQERYVVRRRPTVDPHR